MFITTTKIIVSIAVIYMLWDLISQPIEKSDDSTKNKYTRKKQRK